MTGIEIIRVLLARLKTLRDYAPLHVEKAWEAGIDTDYPLDMTQIDSAIELAEKWLANHPPNTVCSRPPKRGG